MTTDAATGSASTDSSAGALRPVDGDARPPVRSLPEWVYAWWAPLVLFAGVGVLVWIAVWFGNTHLTHDAFFPPRPSVGEAWFGGWARWDSEWYRTIVREGYVYFPGVQSSVAFWPSYPIVVKLLSWAFPSIYITGTIVTVVCGAASMVLLRRWAGLFTTRSVALTAVVVMCVYPYSWYLYGAVYSDALWLAAAIGAFLLLERDRMFWAGLVGIVVTAGRPAGLVVALVLVLRVIERRNAAGGATTLRALFSPRGLQRRDLPILVSWLGVGSWCVYLWAKFGDPLLFLKVEDQWGQGAGPRTWFKFRVFDELVHRPLAWSTIGHVVSGLFVFGAIAVLPAVKRRFGWSYTLYCAGLIALPLIGTKDFFSSGRYLLGVFPCAVILAQLLVDRPMLRRVLVPVSLLVLLAMSVAFGRASYLA